MTSSYEKIFPYSRIDRFFGLCNNLTMIGLNVCVCVFARRLLHYRRSIPPTR